MPCDFQGKRFSYSGQKIPFLSPSPFPSPAPAPAPAPVSAGLCWEAYPCTARCVYKLSHILKGGQRQPQPQAPSPNSLHSGIKPPLTLIMRIPPDYMSICQSVPPDIFGFRFVPASLRRAFLHWNLLCQMPPFRVVPIKK